MRWHVRRQTAQVASHSALSDEARMSGSPAQFAVRTRGALKVLAFRPMTAPKLAEVLGVHPRTARRLLSQLYRDGWSSYSTDAPHSYVPTLRFVALAAQIGARAPLAALTAPAVDELHASKGLGATLANPSRDATVCVVRCSGERSVEPPPAVLVPHTALRRARC